MTAQDKKAVNRVTTLAVKRLREQHPEDYEAHKVAVAEELGVTYRRRKTKEEKARDALTALLAENPSLRSDLFKQVEEQIAEREGVASQSVE